LLLANIISHIFTNDVLGTEVVPGKAAAFLSSYQPLRQFQSIHRPEALWSWTVDARMSGLGAAVQSYRFRASHPWRTAWAIAIVNNALAC
jgi:hypothetical protein